MGQLSKQKLPNHIAIIMDGNGRWAKRQGQERSFGHQQGVTAVREATEAAAELGIGYLTLYAFSTENWNRPTEEVQILMDLLVSAVENETPTLLKNNVRLQAIGDLDRLFPQSKEKLLNCIRQTEQNTGLTLILALSYSSRMELTRAMRLIAQEVIDGQLSLDQISEQTLSEHLYTRHYPDPDLLIRTGGEQRISNFLLWQISYAELYFTDLYWPEFNKAALKEAIDWYQNRERRFGKTSEQLVEE